MKPVDYSAAGITRRLKLASELRHVCLSLMKAGRQLRERESKGLAKESTTPSATPVARK